MDEKSSERHNGKPYPQHHSPPFESESLIEDIEESLRINERITNRERDRKRRTERDEHVDINDDLDREACPNKHKKGQRLKRRHLVLDELSGKVIVNHRHKGSRKDHHWDDEVE